MNAGMTPEQLQALLLSVRESLGEAQSALIQKNANVPANAAYHLHASIYSLLLVVEGIAYATQAHIVSDDSVWNVTQ